MRRRDGNGSHALHRRALVDGFWRRLALALAQLPSSLASANCPTASLNIRLPPSSHMTLKCFAAHCVKSAVDRTVAASCLLLLRRVTQAVVCQILDQYGGSSGRCIFRGHMAG